MPRQAASVTVIALLAFLASLPIFLRPFHIILVTEVLILGLFAMSFNLLFGYTGLLSFGHSAFFSVGAYAAALYILRFQPSTLPAIGAAVALSALAAFAIGYFCVRVGEVYFAMLTLAFSQMIWGVAVKWQDVTGGTDGLWPLFAPPISVFGAEIVLASVPNFYYFTLLVAATSGLILFRVVHSSFGLALRAIRENAERAEFIGIAVRRFQLKAFVIAGAFAGLAGALFALFQNIVTPTTAFWTTSGEAIVMTLLGGKSTFLGPTIGALFYTVLQDAISTYTEFWLLYLGSILVGFVLLVPEGILGLVKTRLMPVVSKT